MSPTDPRHGSDAGFQAHRRSGIPACEPCRVANFRSHKAAQIRLINGELRRIPLGEEAWRIVHNLPRRVVRERTGFSASRLSGYDKGGPECTVHVDTQRALLDAGKVPTPTCAGIQRRVRALAAIGYSARYLARVSGTEVENIKLLRRRADVPPVIRQSFADKILVTYEDLHMKPAPRSRHATWQRRIATENGWLPPLAWDDIDDPDETPTVTREDHHHHRTDVDHAVVVRMLDGERLPSSPAEKAEVCRIWVRSGGSLRELEDRLGWKVERYYRISDDEAVAS